MTLARLDFGILVVVKLSTFGGDFQAQDINYILLSLHGDKT
jgi:hypothetical protein